MKEMPLISVIVPIYNVENYLNRCVESIVNQTYTNLEIILVDDGSTDNCPIMCDEWAEKDNRIKVLHLSNGGAGKARNEGIQKACGEWIVFLDGDDYIHINMIGHLYNLIDETTDLAECTIVKTTNESADFSSNNVKASITICDSENALRCLISDKMFCQTPPNKLYKSSIVKKYPFPEGNLIDDEFWTYKVIGDCRNLKHSSLKLYAYRQQQDSVMHKKYSILRLQALDAKKERLSYLASRYPSLLDIAKIDFIESCIFQGQMARKYLKGDEKKSAFNTIKKYMKSVDLKQSALNSIKFSHRVWIIMSRVSVKFVCFIKNLLNKGL